MPMTEPLDLAADPLAVESEMPSSLMTVNLGPSHPAMPGTVRLVGTLDGETIVEAIPEIGFLHRGFSKSSEQSTWHPGLPYTDRLNYVSPVLNTVGGVATDLPPGWEQRLRDCLPRVMELTNEIDTLLTRNRIFVDRTRNIGVISAEEAIDFGFTGPCLRACGVNYDVRKAHPYSVYDRMDFEVPLGSNGDTYDRYVLRLLEIHQSHRIVVQCLEQMPPGPIIIDDWRYALPPQKEVL